MKRCCDNCYHHVRPTVGVIAPMYKCLEAELPDGTLDPEIERCRKENGHDCSHWHPKPSLS